MQTYKMDGLLFKQIVTNGAANLRANYKTVDALNVFPVPDGDTGTNMKMTIEAGAHEISEYDEKSIYQMSKKLSRGMLMGARGNSGVILSQLFRGIYKGLAGYDEVNAVELANAFISGVKQGYHAVLKPVEGTILTVARESAEYAKKKVNRRSSIEEYFKHLLQEARASLERTPELLPVLKEAGVIDSGGAGLIYVLEGMAKALDGEFIKEEAVNTSSQTVIHQNFNANSELEYGYCTEFILQLQHKKVNIKDFDISVITNYLETLGDSIVALKDEDIVKIHVHTKTPGNVLNYCQQFGEYVTLKIENMSVQHSDGPAKVDVQPCNCPECVEMRKQTTPKKFAVVAVATGEGLINAFKEMGVDYVVEGGQSMNPSAEDFTKGFDLLNAQNIIVFPNNSNIVLTAEQAAKYYKGANVFVVPTKTIAQGYSALTMLDLSLDDPEGIINEISEVISNVTTGLITYAVRNTEIEGLKINEGDYIGICNGRIVTSQKERLHAVKELFAEGKVEEKDIITIIYGKDVTEEELANLTSYIEEKYSNLEIDTINGQQDVYSYIFSIE